MFGAHPHIQISLDINIFSYALMTTVALHGFFSLHKYEVTHSIENLCQLIKREFGDTVKSLRIDNAKDFTNTSLSNFFTSKGMRHEISCPYTP